MTSTRRLISLIASGAAAISAVILFMIAPLVLYRLATGGSLNHEGADWEIWLLVGGGGIVLNFVQGGAPFLQIFRMRRVSPDRASPTRPLWM